MENESVPVKFLACGNVLDQYTAMLTQDGGMVFSQLVEKAKDELCEEIIKACEGLIEFYSFSNVGVREALKTAVGSDETFIAIQQLRLDAEQCQLFPDDDEEPTAFLTLHLSSRCFALVDQLGIAGEYSSPQSLFSHIANFALWRMNYERGVVRQGRMH